MAQATPEGLAARPHPGPEPLLTAEQLRELETIHRRGATAHGWPDALWTARRVAEMIRRHFGVEYHAEHARKILRRRIGWSGQRRRRRPSSATPRRSITEGARSCPGSSSGLRDGRPTRSSSTSRASRSRHRNQRTRVQGLTSDQDRPKGGLPAPAILASAKPRGSDLGPSGRHRPPSSARDSRP